MSDLMKKKSLLEITQEYSKVFHEYRDHCMQRVLGNVNLGERDLIILSTLEAYGEVSFKRLFELLIKGPSTKLTRSSLSQSVSALWKKKLVAKKPDPSDQRQPLISITKLGQVKWSEADTLNRQLLVKAIEAMHLSDEEEAVLVRAYQRGLESFQEWSQSDPLISSR